MVCNSASSPHGKALVAGPSPQGGWKLDLRGCKELSQNVILALDKKKLTPVKAVGKHIHPIFVPQYLPLL